MAKCSTFINKTSNFRSFKRNKDNEEHATLVPDPGNKSELETCTNSLSSKSKNNLS